MISIKILKNKDNRLPKLFKREKVISNTIKGNNQLKMNQNWLKEQTKQYKYLAEGEIMDNISNMSKSLYLILHSYTQNYNI